jgi:transposase-like protein
MPESKPNHPYCPACGVPMWLGKVELGEIAAAQEFECKVCDRKLKRAVPREQNSTDLDSRPI